VVEASGSVGFVIESNELGLFLFRENFDGNDAADSWIECSIDYSRRTSTDFTFQPVFAQVSHWHSIEKHRSWPSL
jgi:hypothetical protein